MEASTDEEWFAQEREIAEGEAVVAGLIDDLLDDFCREGGEGDCIVLYEEKGVHGSRKIELDGSERRGER